MKISRLYFTTEQYSIVYMYYIFLIHSLVQGCLGYFCFLAIVNTSSMNIAEHVYLDYYVESLGICQNTTQSKVAKPVESPINNMSVPYSAHFL